MKAAKPARPRVRTGLNALKARVKLRGLDAIDLRSSGGRALVRWRSELIGDLGGEAALSAQQRALVDAAVRTRLFLDHVDGWLLRQRSLIGGQGSGRRGRRTATPVLRERQQLAEHLARVLGQLGLERRAPAGPSLLDKLRGADPAPKE